MERNLDAERIRRFHIEHELELRRAYDRKVGWALALEHTAGDAAELLVAVDEAGAVADETARDGKFADVVDRRYAMPPSERDERVALTVEKGIPLDDERASAGKGTATEAYAALLSQAQEQFENDPKAALET